MPRLLHIQPYPRYGDVLPLWRLYYGCYISLSCCQLYAGYHVAFLAHSQPEEPEVSPNTERHALQVHHQHIWA